MADTNLKIIAYDSPAGGRKQSEIGSFTVDFNPASFTINNKIEYKQPDVKGQTGGDPQFEKIPPLEFSIEFTIDGTGVAPTQGGRQVKKEYVKKQIKELRNVTGSNINGEIHRPNYLAVLWGSFYIECVMTALNITYTLFDREGVPLRAKVNCSFLERIAPGKAGRQSRLESSDLTTAIIFKEGDSLPLIAKSKYDDPGYYIQLARANKITHFRNIAPGTRIVLPPLRQDNE
jgi:nucleoid-associated protein YgaU